MIEVLKKIAVILFALAMIALSGFILYGNKNIPFLEKEKTTPLEIATTTSLLECTDDQYEDNGVCVSKVVTPTNVSTTTASSSQVVGTTTSQGTSPLLGYEESKPVVKNSSTTVDKTIPRIQTVKVTGGGATMSVSIVGLNFYAKTNTVILVTSTGFTKNMTLPAYPMPDGTQSINFKVTDFRTNAPGPYSFQVIAKNKESNVFVLDK